MARGGLPAGRASFLTTRLPPPPTPDPQELKLSPVTALASCQLRERDWCNVVTVHSGCPAAYTWRLAAGALGEHALTPPRSSGAPVTCCAVSACGNYALLGSDCGDVDRFNLQSGLHRGGFTRPLQPPGAPRAQPAVKPGKARAFWAMAGPRREVEGGACAHEGAVTLVDSDACNARLVTAGRDGAVRLWAFKTRALLGEAQAGCPVERGVLHRGSGLLACACADAIVRVFDTSAEQPRRVRSFGPHGDAITDLAFSEDARWLLSASMDGVLRVWDLPAGRLLQALRLGGAPITALALSPEMDMLATAHMGKRCVPLLCAHAAAVRRAPVNPTGRARLQSRCHAAGVSDGAQSRAGGSFADTARHAWLYVGADLIVALRTSLTPHPPSSCAQGHLPVGQPAGLLRRGRVGARAAARARRSAPAGSRARRGRRRAAERRGAGRRGCARGRGVAGGG